ncbi:hypothetical protein SeMB42_g06311 [Synchytrium endobioticum]|uniref:Uncharacterized protein n=1 Tax=Synchytrium endobioticum TaxID=286115 RepID=A0A507CLL1_9FUNG|nr:hypothetical protein SeMB42_g06311 [Synchytrium endobioticum]
MLVTARAKNGNDETDLDGKKLQLRYNDRFINLTLRKRKSNMAATESERMREEETVVNDAGPTTEKNVPEVNPGDSTDDGVEGLPKPTTPLRRCLRMKKGKPVDSNALEQGALRTKLNLASRPSSSSSRIKGKERFTGTYGKLSAQELQRGKDFALCVYWPANAKRNLDLVGNLQPQDPIPGVSFIKEKQTNIKPISTSTPSTSTSSSSQSAYLTGVKVLASMSRKLIYTPITLFIPEVSTVAMIDSGASTSFISKAFVDRHGISSPPLFQTQTVSLASGNGTISLTHETTDLTVCLEEPRSELQTLFEETLNKEYEVDIDQSNARIATTLRMRR